MGSNRVAGPARLGERYIGRATNDDSGGQCGGRRSWIGWIVKEGSAGA